MSAVPSSRFDSEQEAPVIALTVESIPAVSAVVVNQDESSAPRSSIDAPHDSQITTYEVHDTAVAVVKTDEEEDFEDPLDAQEPAPSLADDSIEDVSEADSVSAVVPEAAADEQHLPAAQREGERSDSTASASSSLSFDSIFDDEDLAPASTPAAAGVVDDDFDLMAFGSGTDGHRAPEDAKPVPAPQPAASVDDAQEASSAPASEQMDLSKSPAPAAGSGSRDFQDKPSTEPGSAVTFEPLPPDYVEDNEHLASQAERLKVSRVLMKELGSRCYVELDQDGAEGYEGWVYRNNLSLRVHVTSNGEAHFRTSKLRRRISADRARELIAQAAKSDQRSGTERS